MTDKHSDDDKQMKDNKTYDPSRRRFLKNTGMIAGGVVGGSFLGGLLTNNFATKNETGTNLGMENAVDYQEALQFFTRREDFAVLGAATEQIFPKDESGPGAIELGVPYYIDKQLAGQWGVNARDYRQGPFVPRTQISERVEEKRGEQSSLDRASIFLLGLRKMNTESMKRFATSFDKATEEQQIEILTDMESGKIKLNGVLSEDFFFLLHRSTLEGAYSDPLYGGNRNMAGWKMKEFPGAQASYIGARGYFENKKFNNYMGTGALGVTIDDYAGDNVDHTNLNYLHGYEIHYGQLGTRPISHNQVPRGTPKWGKEFKKNTLHYFNRNLFITPQTGFLPNRYSYLDLDPTYKDALGDPLIRVTVKYSDEDRNRARDGVIKCGEIMEKMGADIIDVDVVADDIEFDHKFFTGHFTGGVIMGSSPENSAVNTYSQMWGMENLFVVGGSSFPHMGNYNPTGTIGAFAYRAAEGMNKYLSKGGLLTHQVKEKNA